MSEKPHTEMVERPAEHGRDTRDSHSIGGETAIEPGQGQFHPPKVDTTRAAEIRPSKLHGKALRLMVTFVAGTGVRVSLP